MRVRVILGMIALCVGVFAICATAGPALAQDTNALLRQLSDDARAEQAVEALSRQGVAALPKLQRLVESSSDVAARGWAVVAMGRIPGPEAEGALTGLHSSNVLPMLVRTWAAAARVDRAQTSDELVALLPLQGSFPALDRPFKKKFTALLSSSAKPMSVRQMLEMAQRMPQLQQMIIEPVLARGAGQLVDTMVRTPDDNTRRTAAAYLGTLAQRKGVDEVANAVVAAYRFDPRAEDVPWAGGALFLPGLQWPKKQATQLVGGLIAWHVWSDVKGNSNYQQQIHNNIRSVGLGRVVGYNSPGWNSAPTEQWLQIWAQTVGKQDALALLKRVGVPKDSKYYGAIR